MTDVRVLRPFTGAAWALALQMVVGCNASPQPSPGPAASAPTQDDASSGRATVTGTAAPGAIVTLEGLDSPPAPLPDGPAVMDQYAKQFVPDLLFVRVGQVVEFRNSEDTDHNVQVLRMPAGITVMNESGSKGQVFRHVFEHAASYDVNCDIHPGMRATIVATTAPFATLTTPAGQFTIPDVPAGKYLLTSTMPGRDVTQEVAVAAPLTTVSVR